MARRIMGQNAEPEEEDVNMTPLLDIVFIMLIFFIVTSTFIKEPGIDPERPKTITQVAENPAILVGISSDDLVYINGDVVDMDEVTFRVKELRRETPQGSAVIQADVGSKSRTLIEVLNRVKEADIQEISVSTESS